MRLQRISFISGILPGRFVFTHPPSCQHVLREPPHKQSYRDSPRFICLLSTTPDRVNRGGHVSQPETYRSKQSKQAYRNRAPVHRTWNLNRPPTRAGALPCRSWRQENLYFHQPSPASSDGSTAGPYNQTAPITETRASWNATRGQCCGRDQTDIPGL